MKVRTRFGCAAEIAKTLDPAEADGENVGIAKFGDAGAGVLVDAMQQILTAGGAREWLPRAFAAFATTRPLRIVETRGYPWIEIDYPEDYWRAGTRGLPPINDGDCPPPAPRREAAPAGHRAPPPAGSP